jgi:hypothetical protein
MSQQHTPTVEIDSNQTPRHVMAMWAGLSDEEPLYNEEEILNALGIDGKSTDLVCMTTEDDYDEDHQLLTKTETYEYLVNRGDRIRLNAEITLFRVPLNGVVVLCGWGDFDSSFPFLFCSRATKSILIAELKKWL